MYAYIGILLGDRPFLHISRIKVKTKAILIILIVISVTLIPYYNVISLG
jgi:hypothetical protein